MQILVIDRDSSSEFVGYFSLCSSEPICRNCQVLFEKLAQKPTNSPGYKYYLNHISHE